MAFFVFDFLDFLMPLHLPSHPPWATQTHSSGSGQRPKMRITRPRSVALRAVASGEFMESLSSWEGGVWKCFTIAGAFGSLDFLGVSSSLDFCGDQWFSAWKLQIFFDKDCFLWLRALLGQISCWLRRWVLTKKACLSILSMHRFIWIYVSATEEESTNVGMRTSN